jgi:hypothetical protein
MGVNVRMDHRGIRWDVVNWLHLAWDGDHWQAVANSVMKSIRGWEFLD